MEKFTLANGPTITCMDKVFSAGLTEDNMKANTQTTRKKDLEYILGPMDVSMRDNGKMASSMVRVYIRMLIKLRELAFGKKENVWHGLMMMILKNKWKK